MTERLEAALAAVLQMSQSEQDTIAEAMLSLARLGQPREIEREHRAAVAEGVAQARRGEFAEGTPGEIVARAFERARR